MSNPRCPPRCPAPLRCLSHRLVEAQDSLDGNVAIRHSALELISTDINPCRYRVSFMRLIASIKQAVEAIPLDVPFGADGFNLRDDWLGNSQRKVTGRYQRLRTDEILAPVESTDFLQAVSMLHTLEHRKLDIEAGKIGKAVQPVSAKRASILSMPLSAYREWANRVEAGFVAAARRTTQL
jgi:hypothetical protein